MARYEITGPDGAKYQVNAPDGATDEQVLAFAQQQFANQAPQQQAPPQPQSSFLRATGLSLRGAAQAATDLMLTPADILAGINNWGQRKFRPEGYYVTINGKKEHRTGIIPTASEQRDADLTTLGLPEPGNSGERVANLAVRGSLGAAGVAKAAAMLPGAVARVLAQRPALQMVSGATSGVAAGTARERGYGPMAQLAAGFAGGMAPALAAPRLPPGGGVFLPGAGAAAAAGASARATPGVASTATNVTGGAAARGTGSGYTYGTVGPDPTSLLNTPMTRVAARGGELGFRMTPGQATGSRALQQLEAKLESQPMTSGPFNTIKQTNQTVLNRATARSIGMNSDTVDETTMATALERMEKAFERAADDQARNIDPRGFMTFISTLQDDMRGLVKGVASEPLIEDVTRYAANGSATGKQLHSLSSKLGKAAYKQMTTQSGDRDLGQALYRAKDYVDDVLMQGMQGDDLQAFQQARGHYRNLMLLTQRAGVVNPSSGNIQGRSLANVLQGRDRRGFTFGGNRSDMYDAARFSQAFAPIVGDSGTATRSALPGPTDWLVSLPFNLATRAYVSSPSIALATRAAAGARAGSTYRRGLFADPLQVDPIVLQGLFAEETARR